MPTLKPNTPTDPREQLANLPADQVALFQNVAALRAIVADELARHLQRAQVAIQPPVWSVGSQRANLLPHIGAELPAASVLLTHLESSAEYAIARDAIQPILAAVAELEQREAAHRGEVGQAEQALRAAIEREHSLALEVAERAPAVAKAREALARLKP